MGLSTADASLSLSQPAACYLYLQTTLNLLSKHFALADPTRYLQDKLLRYKEVFFSQLEYLNEEH